VLQIGPVKLATNLLLAPIAGYCDLAFRLICRHASFMPEADPRSTFTPTGGVGLACTDLLSPQGLLRGSASSLDLARTSDEDKPVGMQLYGSDPDIMAEGALWAVRHGATVVDINMGCPVDKVTKKDGGSRLLCIPDTAVEIARRCARVLEPHGVPLTCKMRLGWFDDAPVALWLAPRLIDAGAQAITVHGRTTQQKFMGVVSHEGIARVVEAVGRASQRTPAIPVIGNGDVRDAHDVVAMIAKTGCAGVMIGRGALSTPWLFRDAWTLQTKGFVPSEPTTRQKLDLIRMYLDWMIEFRGEHYAMVQMRRRISWFGKRLGRELDYRGTPMGCKPLREAMRGTATPDDCRVLLDRFEAGELRGGGYDAPVEEAAV